MNHGCLSKVGGRRHDEEDEQTRHVDANRRHPDVEQSETVVEPHLKLGVVRIGRRRDEVVSKDRKRAETTRRTEIGVVEEQSSVGAEVQEAAVGVLDECVRQVEARRLDEASPIAREIRRDLTGVQVLEGGVDVLVASEAGRVDAAVAVEQFVGDPILGDDQAFGMLVDAEAGGGGDGLRDQGRMHQKELLVMDLFVGAVDGSHRVQACRRPAKVIDELIVEIPASTAAASAGRRRRGDATNGDRPLPAVDVVDVEDLDGRQMDAVVQSSADQSHFALPIERLMLQIADNLYLNRSHVLPARICVMTSSPSDYFQSATSNV